jgi:tetratricopeptide (TPR) repeat protein
MRPLALARAFVVVAFLCGAAGQRASADAGDPTAIADLIRRLGDEDYAVREAAADRLAAIGADAADALLAAAESSDDLEVALKARWLVEALPLASEADPPAVTSLLDRYARGDFDTRVSLMHRLLRLDDDIGIAPLARIVRLERTTAGSRIAAALLAREWHPGDPVWQQLAPRIASGIGPSSRPTARLLRALVDCSSAPSAAAVDEAIAAVRLLERSEEGASGIAVGDEGDGTLGDAKTTRIFRRMLAELLATAGRRDAAVAEADRLFDACRGSAAEEDLLAAEMAWLSDHGVPQAAELLGDRVATTGESFAPLVAYAAAVGQRRKGDEAAAADLADRAAAALGKADVDLSRRLQAAMLLARWGAPDWALREYRAIVDNPESPLGELALTGVIGAEFLHDQGRDAEAAEMLRVVLDGRGGDDTNQILMRLERDPRGVRSRMLYFTACDAASRGDTAAHRSRLEESLAAYPKDVDSLIAWYRLGDGDAAQRADAAARVRQALEQIDEEIQAVPDDANGYNEYAWLVANTEGDIGKALRYSKRSLEFSFDSPSYLDTLAHCRAASGDAAGAERTQLLAVRQEPHNVTIRRNLERFRAARSTGSP